MVVDNKIDDANGKSPEGSDQDQRSRKKRNILSEVSLETPTDSPVKSHIEFPKLVEETLKDTLYEVESLKGGCPQSTETPGLKGIIDADWEDSMACQLQELLTQNLFAIFQSAVKRIVECGYSDEIAERVILRSGLYHGKKDVVSNIVGGALALLSREKDFDTTKHLLFADVSSLVEYTLLEMIYVLREVKPALTVPEAMWCLLILDLNLVHACTIEGDLLVELSNQGSPGNSSENTQSNPDKQQFSNPSIPMPQTLQSKVAIASATSQEPKCKNSQVCQAAKGKGSSTPLPEVQAKLKALALEDKSGASRKTSSINSKKEMLRRKTYQFERNCRGRTSKSIKANLTAWGSLVLDRKLNSSGYSDASKKISHSKGNASVKSNKPVAEASSDSSCPSSSIAPAADTFSVPPMQDNANKKDPASLALEPKSSIKAPDNTTISSVVPNYYAGIPYDESLGKYVPQNERDEEILMLISHMKASEKKIQQWSDWANEKVMQATRRLGKDQAELKILRQEKEDAKRFYKEKQMLEENTKKRLLEMEQALVNFNGQFETATSYLYGLKGENVALVKEMEALKASAVVSATKMEKALVEEQEIVKKCQAKEVERRSLQEDFSTLKQETTDLQQQQEKAKKRLNEFEVLWKNEESVNQEILQEAYCLKAEREQLVIQRKIEEDILIEQAKRNMRKCEKDIQKIKNEITQLKLQSEKSKIEALKRDNNVGLPPQMRKGRLSFYEENFGSSGVKMERDWECVMCMTEQMSVVFLPCAHQVLCANCNIIHEKKGMKECPSCRTPIKKRISVRFADS